MTPSLITHSKAFLDLESSNNITDWSNINIDLKGHRKNSVNKNYVISRLGRKLKKPIIKYSPDYAEYSKSNEYSAETFRIFGFHAKYPADYPLFIKSITVFK